MPMNLQHHNHSPWWKTGVVYQIYPRSFAHGGSGNDPRVGDLRGVIQRLDYLASLGVDALWLSPTYPSPMHDFGYDVADYRDIHPLFGSLADMDELIASAHERDIRVVLDWVPNHTSHEHEWFQESRSSRSSARRDWYVWRDGPPGTGPGTTPPNDWMAAFGSIPAWTYEPESEQWYHHSFLPSQPDLDWRNPHVEAAMFESVRWWLERGVDGFRIDVVHLIGKDVSDVYASTASNSYPYFLQVRDDYTHEILRRLRALVDSYPGDRMLVGEVGVLDAAEVARFYGEHDELHQNFNFSAIYTTLDAISWGHHIRAAEEQIGGRGAWPTWVLSNHDCHRHRTRFGGSEESARLAALLLLTLRGTPFLYAGEELGLESADIPPARIVDPGGRDGARAPIPWEDHPSFGWPTDDPWLPWPPQALQGLHASAQEREDSSILRLYQHLLQLRRSTPCLHSGDIEVLAPGAHESRFAPGALVYRRTLDDQERLVVLDLAGHGGEAHYPPFNVVVASTHPRRPLGLLDQTVTLEPHEGVVLAPS